MQRTTCFEKTGRVPARFHPAGTRFPVAGRAGSETKVGFTGLLPGGMTLDAGTGLHRFLHAGSPEPVIGFGAAKGLDAYYRAVLEFRIDAGTALIA